MVSLRLLLLAAALAARCDGAAPVDVTDNEADHYSLSDIRGGCDCMEYWNCVMSGGNPYSYCGLSDSMVCCFVPEGAKPVSSLLPTAASKQPRCGRKGADSGKAGVAEPAEWPWHAAILEKPDDLYVCGASLLDQSWVLTAAHCVEEFVRRGTVSRLKVRLGELDVTDGGEPLPHEEFDVAAAALYPAFDNRSLAHDIALLRLRSPASRRAHIDVVCVPRPAQPTRAASCVITGWGRRSEDSEHSVVLKEISVPLWKNSDCEKMLRRHFGPRYSLPDTAICAGAEGRDACDGDGGGPLVCEENGRWYQVGVISFGVGCGRRNTPGVYTRVAMYEQWIMDTVLRHRRTKQ